MAAPEAYSRSALSRASLWRPIRMAWAWLAPYAAKALPRHTYIVLAVVTLLMQLPGEFVVPPWIATSRATPRRRNK